MRDTHTNGRGDSAARMQQLEQFCSGAKGLRVNSLPFFGTTLERESSSGPEFIKITSEEAVEVAARHGLLF
jgi:hypothetical protein